VTVTIMAIVNKAFATAMRVTLAMTVFSAYVRINAMGEVTVTLPLENVLVMKDLNYLIVRELSALISVGMKVNAWIMVHVSVIPISMVLTVILPTALMTAFIMEHVLFQVKIIIILPTLLHMFVEYVLVMLDGRVETAVKRHVRLIVDYQLVMVHVMRPTHKRPIVHVMVCGVGLTV